MSTNPIIDDFMKSLQLQKMKENYNVEAKQSNDLADKGYKDYDIGSGLDKKDKKEKISSKTVEVKHVDPSNPSHINIQGIDTGDELYIKALRKQLCLKEPPNKKIPTESVNEEDGLGKELHKKLNLLSKSEDVDEILRDKIRDVIKNRYELNKARKYYKDKTEKELKKLELATNNLINGIVKGTKEHNEKLTNQLDIALNRAIILNYRGSIKDNEKPDVTQKIRNQYIKSLEESSSGVKLNDRNFEIGNKLQDDLQNKNRPSEALSSLNLPENKTIPKKNYDYRNALLDIEKEENRIRENNIKLNNKQIEELENQIKINIELIRDEKKLKKDKDKNKIQNLKDDIGTLRAEIDRIKILNGQSPEPEKYEKLDPKLEKKLLKEYYQILDNNDYLDELNKKEEDKQIEKRLLNEENNKKELEDIKTKQEQQSDKLIVNNDKIKISLDNFNYQGKDLYNEIKDEYKKIKNMIDKIEKGEDKSKYNLDDKGYEKYKNISDGSFDAFFISKINDKFKKQVDIVKNIDNYNISDLDYKKIKNNVDNGYSSYLDKNKLYKDDIENAESIQRYYKNKPKEQVEEVTKAIEKFNKELELPKEQAKQLELEKEKEKQLELEKEKAKQLELEKEKPKQLELENQKIKLEDNINKLKEKVIIGLNYLDENIKLLPIQIKKIEKLEEEGIPKNYTSRQIAEENVRKTRKRINTYKYGNKKLKEEIEIKQKELDELNKLENKGSALILDKNNVEGEEIKLIVHDKERNKQDNGLMGSYPQQKEIEEIYGIVSKMYSIMNNINVDDWKGKRERNNNEKNLYTSIDNYNLKPQERKSEDNILMHPQYTTKENNYISDQERQDFNKYKQSLVYGMGMREEECPGNRYDPKAQRRSDFNLPELVYPTLQTSSGQPSNYKVNIQKDTDKKVDIETLNKNYLRSAGLEKPKEEKPKEKKPRKPRTKGLPHKWIDYVKAVAKKYNIKYPEAVSKASELRKSNNGALII